MIFVFSASYIFIIIMWKKQAPNACFNLFLVLLLSLNWVAFFNKAIQKKHLVKENNSGRHNNVCIKYVFYE